MFKSILRIPLWTVDDTSCAKFPLTAEVEMGRLYYLNPRIVASRSSAAYSIATCQSATFLLAIELEAIAKSSSAKAHGAHLLF
jgi:hypothetical protein